MNSLHSYNSAGILFGILCVCLCLNLSVMAQLSVSGSVSDADHDTPMLFAQIAVSNSTIGTVSNEDGRFFLGIPEIHLKDTLVVTYLGYETARLAVAGLIGKNTLIRLKPKELLLKEVEVVALTPEEVMRRMSVRISANYGSDSILLTAFYRSQKFAGKKLAEYAEAVITDLKTGYYALNTMKEMKELASHSNVTLLVKGRVVSDTSLVNSMGDVGKMAGCLGCIFAEDLVENNFRTMFGEEAFRYYKYTMEELSNPEGGKIYHIRFDQAEKKIKGFKGELFIDGSSFAMMKIVLRPSYQGFEKYEKDKMKRIYTIQNIPGWIAGMPLYDRTLTYSKRKDYWCLSTIHDEQWVTFTQPSTGQRIRMGYKNDLVVTDVSRDHEQLRGFTGDKQAGVNRRWDQLAGQADETFWANFNYLPIEEQLRKNIKGLEK